MNSYSFSGYCSLVIRAQALVVVGLSAAFLTSGCAGMADASVTASVPSREPVPSPYESDAIVYNLPRTQFRFTGTIQVEITAVDLDLSNKEPYSYELTWDSPAFTAEAIPDPAENHLLPMGKQSIFASKTFGMSFTTEGFPSDASAATTDRVVPFLTSVLKVATSLGKMAFWSAPIPDSDEQKTRTKYSELLKLLDRKRADYKAVETYHPDGDPR